MPIVVVMFAMGAAMGQFGCYAYDGALKLSFSKLSNQTGMKIPTGIDVLFNILRATSLFHIFYGFCLILVFHMSLIFMLQSSMREFNGMLEQYKVQGRIQVFMRRGMGDREYVLAVKPSMKKSVSRLPCSGEEPSKPHPSPDPSAPTVWT